jgi:hypothetical protein
MSVFLCRSISRRCPAFPAFPVFPAQQYNPVQQYNSAQQYRPAQQQPRSLATRKTKDAGLRNII